MITPAEETRLRREEILDRLCDRDDFSQLSADRQQDFLIWSDDNWTNYYDASTVDGEWVADFAIDAMFDAWRARPGAAC